MTNASTPAGVSPLTVVIPHFNDEEGLAVCLDRLANQTGIPGGFRVIVVDNNSRRLPAQVCANYASVSLESEPTVGPGPARNHGAGMANSEIIAFVDSDCYPDPDWAAAIMAHFADPASADVVGGDVRIIQDKAELSGVEAFESVFGYRFELFIRRDHYSGSGNMAVRRAVFEAVGGFGGIEIAEDMDWGKRATTLGYRVAYDPKMKVETPARQTFAELTRKWDRHILHDYAKVSPAIPEKTKWVLRAIIVLLSGAADVVTIGLSDRIEGIGNRFRGLVCLIRIRAYRCRKMLALVGASKRSSAAGSWRK